jgi:hypothetical protein
MWVWQSQAPAGTSKFTGVDGCDAAARADLPGMVIPAAMEASRILRRVSMVFSLVRFCALIFEAAETIARHPVNARHVFAKMTPLAADLPP